MDFVKISGIAGMIYELCKNIIDNCPPFLPILSVIDTPTYKLAKFLVSILKSLTINEYNFLWKA